MSFFEKHKPSKLTLDDTVPLTCLIETAQKSKDHIEYILRVQRGPILDNCWQLTKRYSDFASLDSELKISNIDLPLPPKKVFGNLDREFVAERQQGLQQYINAILCRHQLACSISVKRFLDNHNYAASLPEIALQHVSMAFRSEPNWEVIEPLPDIGWRIRKHYIMVKPLSQPKLKQVLSWCDFGPYKYIPDKELSAIFKILPSIQHPFIYPLSHSTSNENGGLSIRIFYEKGTLRDCICKSKPKGHFLKKYGNPKLKSVLELNVIRAIGKQILETLKFLQEKGLPYCHLHAGNVILDSGCVKLLDIENWLLGIPSYYRRFYTQLKRIQTTELIDVYCFGHLLYEMAFGEQLETECCDNFPSTCPPDIKSVLESILSTESCKTGLPSVSDLLSHPLFSSVPLQPFDKPQLKIPSKLKECIRLAKDEMEKSLKEEQKVIHQIKRVSKAKEFHMSEDEKKKRRKSKKKALENGPDTVTEEPATPVTPSTPSSPAALSKMSASNGPAPPPPPPLPSTGSGAPPPAPPPPPPPPSQSTVAASLPPPSSDRSALLGSITGFKKGKLKKAETVDKSGPKI